MYHQRLERNLRNYSCLTVGDKITINYNSRKYYIGIVEVKPKKAVTIIETDCEVDFAPPLDYVEPEPQFKRTSSDPKAVPMGFGKPPPRRTGNFSFPHHVLRPAQPACAHDAPAVRVTCFHFFEAASEID